ncbi:MAG TPA: DUF1015 domain-containing protein [Solirubrobacteraceae bacterium]|nr:DUF1015 domain-containing protein [Solirubrobacteraceae bacterium]
MADVSPLQALHYDLDRTGGLGPVAAPPYDVIDREQRAELLARSPYNVVAIDLPEDPGGGDPYAYAASTLRAWREQGVVVEDAAPALWALEQAYTGPDGRRRTRHGLFARVRVEDYGPGRIRPHERTHPGPKEDRLRLTRATRANLSPIFSLYDGDAWSPLRPHLETQPFGELIDDDGTAHRLWRVGDPDAIAAAQAALRPAELLIADGHHRYETARVYADEAGTEAARHALMCLVSLGDPGLTIFPTHRLLSGLDDERRVALREAIRRDWDVEEVAGDELAPAPDGRVRIGYLDAHHRRPLRLTLKDPAIADAALPGKPPAYRRLDTAVTEALLLQGALGMSEDDISHLRGLDYARSTAEARDRIDSGAVQAGLFMGPAPVELVRAVAAAGEVMPPKSTYFFPKVPTGLLFNPLA